MQAFGCLILLVPLVSYLGAGAAVRWYVRRELHVHLPTGTTRPDVVAWLHGHGWSYRAADAVTPATLEAQRRVTAVLSLRITARLVFDAHDRLLICTVSTAPLNSPAPVRERGLLLPPSPHHASSATLAEDVLLLACDEVQSFQPAQGHSRLNATLLAGLLGELSLRGRIRVSAATIRVLDRTATDDALLDAVLAMLAGTRELWSADEWLGIFHGRVPDVEARLRERLLEDERLRRTEHGLVATQQLPLPADLQALEGRRLAGETLVPTEHDRLQTYLRRRRRAVLVQRLRAILLKGDQCDERYRLLISLARAAQLLPRPYDRAELKQLESRAQAVTANEVLGLAAAAVRRAEAMRMTPERFVGTPPWAQY